MAIEGFTPPGGTKETMVANISKTERYPMERADNAKRPPKTREPWEEPDDEPASPPPAPAAPVTISKARSPLRDALEAELARKRAQAPAPGGGGPGFAPRPGAGSALRADLEAQLARRRVAGPSVPGGARRPPPPQFRPAGGQSSYSMDPPEGVGSGQPPPGGIKVR